MEFCAYRSEINLEIKRCHCSNKMVKVPNGCIPIAVCDGCPWAARLVNESMIRPTGEQVIAPNPNFKQPGIIEMGKEFISSTIKHVAGWAQSVSDQIYEDRLKICNGCAFRDNMRCTLCTCHLPKKARRKTERCPLNPPKWDVVP